MRSLEKLKKFSEVILISDRMTSETKELTKENRELLKKYFEELKEYNGKLLKLMPKIQKQNGDVDEEKKHKKIQTKNYARSSFY
jgi:Tfp pilus assembly protein PilF